VRLGEISSFQVTGLVAVVPWRGHQGIQNSPHLSFYLWGHLKAMM